MTSKLKRFGLLCFAAAFLFGSPSVKAQLDAHRLSCQVSGPRGSRTYEFHLELGFGKPVVFLVGENVFNLEVEQFNDVKFNFVLAQRTSDFPAEAEQQEFSINRLNGALTSSFLGKELTDPKGFRLVIEEAKGVCRKLNHAF